MDSSIVSQKKHYKIANFIIFSSIFIPLLSQAQMFIGLPNFLSDLFLVLIIFWFTGPLLGLILTLTGLSLGANKKYVNISTVINLLLFVWLSYNFLSIFFDMELL